MATMGVQRGLHNAPSISNVTPHVKGDELLMEDAFKLRRCTGSQRREARTGENVLPLVFSC